VGHVTYVIETGNEYVSVGKYQGESHLGGLGVDGGIILKWSIKIGLI
jgi:hypothetical protein